jgi:hypothetical protein
MSIMSIPIGIPQASGLLDFLTQRGTEVAKLKMPVVGSVSESRFVSW